MHVVINFVYAIYGHTHIYIFIQIKMYNEDLIIDI